MNHMHYSIAIQAPKEKVWDTLWQDATFRDWASIIDPDTYMVGELQQGNEVQFISGDGGYGVTSLIEKLTPGEYLSIRHRADTQDEGKREREKEWTGGVETYRLTEKDGTTTLNITFDVPPTQTDYFEENYPKALARVKELAEN